jgi:hypothetical protein
VSNFRQFLESWGEMNEAQYRDILGEDYESRLKLATIKYGNYSRAHKVLLDIIDKAGSSIASERERALGDIESVLNWASQTFVDISGGRNGLTPRGIQIVEFLSEETSLEVLSLSLINQLNNTLNLAVGSENMWLRGRLTHERFDVRIFKRRHFQTN